MPFSVEDVYNWLLGPEPRLKPGHLWPRWLWLRALGLIFFSAFYSWVYQVLGLLGSDGLLPAGRYLQEITEQVGAKRYYLAPTLLWFSSSDRALVAICIVGLAASILLTLNLWPRAAVAICCVAYLSLISAAQDFASYQSDGMLMAAAFLSFFLAPHGVRPGLGEKSPPSRANLFLVQWVWFQIYFESGVVKMASGDPQWSQLTALDHYYQNGPLPNWIGWYAQQLPHGFQACIALATLIMELGVVWMLFLPRRFRRICFFIVTPFQIGIILTANLAFINYLVLALGFLLLDDEFLAPLVDRLRKFIKFPAWCLRSPASPGPRDGARYHAHMWMWVVSHAFEGLFLLWIFYNTAAQLLLMFLPGMPLPETPIQALEPFRISDHYGLFAVMTTERDEIEFQGSNDGTHWVAYPFRYKPQDPSQAPKFFAPYQPRFDWNLWFASLGAWRDYPFVVNTEARLLQNSPDVIHLFAGNPFASEPPRQVRAVEWQYWFTDLATKRRTGQWWNRKLIGPYAPTLERQPDGKIEAMQTPDSIPSQ